MTLHDYLDLPLPDEVRDGRHLMASDVRPRPDARTGTTPDTTSFQMLLFASPMENRLRFYISRGLGGGDLGRE